jgi:hypothetical protein
VGWNLSADQTLFTQIIWERYMATQNGGSSRRSTKSDEASKKGKALQRAIGKTAVKETPTLGKPVINDPVPKSKADRI